MSPVVDPCEHRNEPPVTMNGRAFLDQLSDCQLLKEEYDP
jgi:hypothetical protein